MSARSSRWGAARRTGYVDPQLRVSDAERTEVADRLSKHYSDGRLDQAEFNERLDRAMKAKTHGDLSGLFTDLPPLEEPETPGAAVRPRDQRPRNRSKRHRTIGLILIAVLVIIVGSNLTLPFGLFFWHFWSPIPWLVIALLVFLWLRATRSRNRP